MAMPAMSDGSPLALLVSGAEPVPAFLHVADCAADTQPGTSALGHFVHPVPAAKSSGVLSAAVQHDHDRED
jgi:hypothetical protein